MTGWVIRYHQRIFNNNFFCKLKLKQWENSLNKLSSVQKSDRKFSPGSYSNKIYVNWKETVENHETQYINF